MEGIRKSFGGTLALGGVDLTVAEGEIHALVGENGAGKSTLMRILSGALAPDSGTMELQGIPFQPANPREARDRGIAMVHQELSLALHLTVAENIMLGNEPRKGFILDRESLHKQAQAALDKVGRPDIPLDSPASLLSPAAQQLVEIARSVALGCEIFVLDEPTSSLGKEDADRLFELLKALKAQGASVIYITHVLEEVNVLADRCTVLRDGWVAGEVDGASFKAEKVVSLMAGRDLDDPYPRSRRARGERLLEINELTGNPLPERASLEVYRGEIVGIAGLMGAGRTALLRTLFGLDPLAGGEIHIQGVAGPRSPFHRWENRTGFLGENRAGEGLAANLSVAQNLCLPGLHRLTRNSLLPSTAAEEATSKWVEALGIRCSSSNQKVAELSGGNQQKVALARLLFMEADLLFLDEPTRGIDVGAKQGIYQWLDGLANGNTPSGNPCGILMVSSYLPELLGICDRIAIMRDGVLGNARPVEELDEHSILLEATGTRVA